MLCTMDSRLLSAGIKNTSISTLVVEMSFSLHKKKHNHRLKMKTMFSVPKRSVRYSRLQESTSEETKGKEKDSENLISPRLGLSASEFLRERFLEVKIFLRNLTRQRRYNL